MPRAFLVFILLISALPAGARTQHDNLGWTGFRNERFGLGLRYPAQVFVSQRSSEMGDGDLFETADQKGRLLIGAVENNDRFTPKGYQSFIRRQSYPGLRVDYAPVGQNWAVLSGTFGQTMVYEKIMFSCGGNVINSFAITYPIVERQFYDPLIESIEDSFRPGNRGCAEHAARN